jgi:hypothetical protein
MAHIVSAPPTLAQWMAGRNAVHTSTPATTGTLFRVSVVLAVLEAVLLLAMVIVLLVAVLR